MHVQVPVKKIDVSIECIICKIVAQAVEKYAEENSTEVTYYFWSTVFVY